jgi:hypothetical protein
VDEQSYAAGYQRKRRAEIEARAYWAVKAHGELITKLCADAQIEVSELTPNLAMAVALIIEMMREDISK